tara:strand:+ start:2336 stop:3124 length:789 start_codon:yes stop_codon:yes gene_type:complete
VDFEKNNDLVSAKEIYLKIIKKDKNNIDALHNLGKILLINDKSEESLEYLKTAIEIDPNNRERWILLCHSLYLAKKYDDLTKTIKIAKENGLNDKNISILEKELEKKGNILMGGYKYAYKTKDSPNKGSSKKADILMENNIKPLPFEVLELYDLEAKGDYDKIHILSEEIIKKYPDSFFGFEMLGKSLIAKKSYEKALKNFEECLKKGSKDLIKSNMAFCYLKLGKENKALKTIKELSEAYPENPIIKKNYDSIKEMVKSKK